MFGKDALATEPSSDGGPRSCCAAAVRDAVQLREALRKAEEFIDMYGHTSDPGDAGCKACAIVAHARAALSVSSETPQEPT